MNNPEVTYIKGEFPILFSAPHCQIHYRTNLTGMHRDAEEFTDQIASHIAEGYKSHALLLNRQVFYDPNSTPIEDNPYKQKLTDIVSQKSEVKALIDIHGLSQNKNCDIAIYIPRRFLNSKKLAVKLADYLAKGPLRGISIIFLNNAKSGDKGESISFLAASKLKIPSVQLEIAQYIREESYLRKSLVDNLGSFASTY